jgi:hypothetical protein
MSDVLQSVPGFLHIVNIVALLSALYFFTSTLSSHLIEAIVGMVNSRGRQLRARLEQALGAAAATALYDDPIIKSLSNGSGDKTHPPSYIEPEMFARVVAAMAREANSLVSQSAVIQDIQSKLAKAPAELEPKLIEWFKAVNDRQTGVYTRWTFLRLILVGFVLASLMDIDTVHIAGQLWNNPQQAESAAKALDDAKKVTDKSGTLSESDQKTVRESVAAAYSQLRTIAPPDFAWQTAPGKLDWDEWLAKVMGWLLTALATSLGAQFWFTMMSESLKLRSAGRKPDDDTTKKDGKPKPDGDAPH